MHQSFVQQFRDASPYINAHYGRVIVLEFAGDVMNSSEFNHLIHDIALLHSLGIKLIIIPGIRPQIDLRLKERGEEIKYHKHLRITNDAALNAAREAAGAVRVDIESRLSMGVANSPMAGSRVHVTSGNFITARPYGVRDGIDFLHTGIVRRIDTDAIQQQLDLGCIVLLSPIGYSPTGEAFNMSAELVAQALASKIGADKLIHMGKQDALVDTKGHLQRQLTVAQARTILNQLPTESLLESDTARHLASAVAACEGGVKRTHILDSSMDGALLIELFTRDGIGTMVNADNYEKIRKADIDDIAGILELIEPLEEEGILVKRSRSKLEEEMHLFTVIERDGTVIGCAGLYPVSDMEAMELVCLAVHDDYRGSGIGERLLDHLLNDAKQQGALQLIVLTTHTAQWFKERGFNETKPEALPIDRQQSYNYQRNSKVLLRKIDID